MGHRKNCPVISGSQLAISCYILPCPHKNQETADAFHFRSLFRFCVILYKRSEKNNQWKYSISWRNADETIGFDYCFDGYQGHDKMVEHDQNIAEGTFSGSWKFDSYKVCSLKKSGVMVIVVTVMVIVVIVVVILLPNFCWFSSLLLRFLAKLMWSDWTIQKEPHQFVGVTKWTAVKFLLFSRQKKTRFVC